MHTVTSYCIIRIHNGANTMAKRLTTGEFIRRATLVHGDTYDYCCTNYINSHTKVLIICRKHGAFSQLPYEHRRGSGCPECGVARTRLTTEEFIQRAVVKHGNYYDYSHAIHRGSHIKVMITCPKHGAFVQTPNSHLSGTGCPDCGEAKSAAALRTAVEKTC